VSLSVERLLSPFLERMDASHHWMRAADGRTFHVLDANKQPVPLTDARVSKHRTNPVGLCPIKRGESTTQVGCFDLDDHDKKLSLHDVVDIAVRVQAEAGKRGLIVHLFTSGGGRGVHGYLLWDQPQDARSVRALMVEVLAACGLKSGTKGVQAGEVEVFPKQDAVPADGFGSMFIPPYSRASAPLVDELDLGVFEPMPEASWGSYTWQMSVSVPVLPAPSNERAATSEGANDLSKVRAFLKSLGTVADHDPWIDAMAAVHHETNGSEEGFGVFDQWSSAQPNYKGADHVSTRWDSFGRTSGRPLTIGGYKNKYGIISSADDFDDLTEDEQRARFKATGAGQDLRAEEVLPPKMDLNMMLASLVYIASKPAFVAYRFAPLIHLPPETMSGVLAHNKTVIKVPDDRQGKEAGAMRDKTVKTYGVWFDSKERSTVYGLVFNPRAGVLCTDENGNAALNLWRALPVAEPEDEQQRARWQQLVQPFLDHVEYLVPVVAEREAFLSWLAHIEQVPGVLPHRHYLMIAPNTQGTGRGWLTALLALVWSGHVALDFNLGDSLRTGFNGALSRKLLVTVAEVREGISATRHQTAQRLKSLTTDTWRSINQKYGAQSSELNCARFLVCSNHDDALPLDDTDRRWVVIHNPTKPRDDSYYKRLYGLLDPRAAEHHEFVAAVRWWLRQRDISAFNPGARAEMNEAKRSAIGACQSDEDAAAVRLVREWPTDLIDGVRLYNEVYGVMPALDGGMRAQRAKLLSSITQQAGVVRLGDFRPKGRPRTHIWAVRNASQWRGQPARGLVLALEQQRQEWPAVELDSEGDDLVGEVQ